MRRIRPLAHPNLPGGSCAASALPGARRGPHPAPTFCRALAPHRRFGFCKGLGLSGTGSGRGHQGILNPIASPPSQTAPSRCCEPPQTCSGAGKQGAASSQPPRCPPPGGDLEPPRQPHPPPARFPGWEEPKSIPPLTPPGPCPPPPAGWGSRCHKQSATRPVQPPLMCASAPPAPPCRGSWLRSGTDPPGGSGAVGVPAGGPCPPH